MPEAGLTICQIVFDLYLQKAVLFHFAVVDFDRHNINSNAIGGYDRNTGILYINSKYDTPEKVLGFVNQTQGMFANNTQYAPILHELGHKYYYDSINKLAISQG